MKRFTTIEIVQDQDIAYLTLSRPEVHNAMDSKMINELITVFHELEDDDSLRLIVLRGKGPSFSSGADLKYMKQTGELSHEENLEDAGRLARLFRLIFTAKSPVAAFVHGQIAGGANGILSASDFVVAAEGTKFRFSEVLLGLIPATIAPYVIRRMGLTFATELMLTGRTFSAEEAMKFSLVNKIIAEEKMDAEISGFVERIKKAGPGAVRKTKQLLRKIYGEPMDRELIQYTVSAIAEARASAEGKEGLNAFLEKRKPGWNVPN